MEAGTSDPMAQQGKQTEAIVKRLHELDAANREKAVIIEKLKDMIAKMHSECFPPEVKCDSERRY